MSLNVFVYGTLLYGPIVKALLGRSVRSEYGVLRSYHRYRIQQPGRNAKGPSIIEKSGSKVEGIVLKGLTDDELAILDKFELAASGYERTLVKVERQNATTCMAYTDRATEALRPYLQGSWSEQESERNHMIHYLEKRIPALRKQWGLDFCN